jgi:hypothetical protein
MLRNADLDRQRARMNDRHRERSESGKKGAVGRWGEHGSANGSDNDSANDSGNNSANGSLNRAEQNGKERNRNELVGEASTDAVGMSSEQQEWRADIGDKQYGRQHPRKLLLGLNRPFRPRG